MYVTEYLSGSLARISVGATGTATWSEWALPYGAASYPWWATTGPDGNLWVTLPYRDRIARLPAAATPTSTSTTSPLATAAPLRIG
jgi:hypothetical protein